MGCASSIYEHLEGKVILTKIHSINDEYIFFKIPKKSSSIFARPLQKAKLIGVNFDDYTTKKLILILTNKIIFKLTPAIITKVLQSSFKVDIQIVRVEEGILYVNLFKNKELINKAL